LLARVVDKLAIASSKLATTTIAVAKGVVKDECTISIEIMVLYDL
jgi:hypothetical protein